MNSLSVYATDWELAQQPPPEAAMFAVTSDYGQLRASPNAALIAIVDDDEWVLRSVNRLVKSAGFRTQTFASAEDFVEFAKHDEIACVILDLRLPGMSGLELQARLAAKHNRVPIVFVSAHDEQKARTQALNAGAVAFLGKPVNDKALLDAIGLALK